MKICFLAHANNYHTKKWCKWFLSNNYEVSVISLTNDKIESVNVYYLNNDKTTNSKDIFKVKYLFTIFKIKKIIKKINPDIISVHYASSYGLIAGIIGLKNYSLSLWGSDIYVFPKKSIVHRLIIKYSLKKAKYILSTSNAMAQEAKKYTKKNIYITPFGVNTKLFSGTNKVKKKSKVFTIGLVKMLEPEYGIDVLIKAVSKIKNVYNINVKLRIAGVGLMENELKQLARNEKIDSITKWLGFIDQERVSYEYSNMDIAVFPSRTESFGVSAVEAQACECPVIISNIDGLLEATNPGISSLVFETNNVDDLVDKILLLYRDSNKREKMGKAGRKYVLKNYEYEKCFTNIEKILHKQTKK